jgi:hypothetical protein
MSEIKTSQIVKPKRNNLLESEARSKPNVLQMIRNVFNEIAAVHAQAEAVAALMTRIAMERAQAHAAAAVEAKKVMIWM